MDFGWITLITANYSCYIIIFTATRHLLESLLDVIGSLYKFHEKPITYLYNTMHYYDKKLKR
jgi:mediator of RNA polymerase II transcription subunit 23